MDEHLLNKLVFFPTPESPCSYLPNRESRSIFLHPDQPLDENIYFQLNQLGFRRSGAHLYRPWCVGCQACQSVRVLVDEFNFSRNQRKVFKHNQAVTFEWRKAEMTDEIYDLYERYINLRHADGDMFPPSQEQFQNFLCQADQSINNFFLCLRVEGKLIAVGVVDLLTDGPSAIYTFFDPDYQAQSPGKMVILWLINWSKSKHLPYLYLGYWIKDCAKMSYKADYQPQEIFNGLHWIQSPESTK